MSKLDHEKKLELIQQLISATEDGPVSGWVDRLGVIALKAGLNRSQINWGHSPDITAFNMVNWCSGNNPKFIEDLVRLSK